MLLKITQKYAFLAYFTTIFHCTPINLSQKCYETPSKCKNQLLTLSANDAIEHDSICLQNSAARLS